MSSKIHSENKSESQYTRCDNCHQDILSEKMFLHEGFCHRNNTYCDHCDKIFLKTDYEEHLKDLRNSINNSGKSTDVDENEYVPVIHEIKQTLTTVVNPNTYYEFIEMPLTEEYTINKPIVISERGNIISSQNNNEYILPYLGINSDNLQYGKEYRQNEYYPMTNSNDYFNYNNQDIYRNGKNMQINYINNNENSYSNDYPTSLNISNYEIKTETKTPQAIRIAKVEKIPSDNQNNHSNLNSYSKKRQSQSKYQVNTERNIKPLNNFHRENLTLKQDEARISQIKTIKCLRSPKITKRSKNY